MKRIILLCYVIFSGLSAAYSQNNYENAVGIRLGGGYYDLFAADFKHFFGESHHAVDLDFGFRPGYGYYDVFNLSLSAAYQYHIETPVDGLQWFLGGGITGYHSFAGNSDSRGFGVSLFPTAGADFKFRGIPLNLSADFRPTFRVSQPNENQYNAINFGNFGVTVRYVLDRY